MRRKVSRIGASTLMVSLPSKWCKANGLKKGDEIELQENGNTLLLSSNAGVTLGEFRTKVAPLPVSQLRSIIGTAYKKGYDTLILEFDDDSLVKDIQKIVDELLGVEIVERTKKSCTIKNISKELEDEFNSILKNSFILVLEISDDVLQSVKNPKLDNLDNISYKRETVTKYTNFCKRVLNKYKRNESEMVFKYLIVWNLEKISNQYYYIRKYTVAQGKAFSNHALQFLEKTNQLLLLYYQAFYEQSGKKIEELGRKKDDLLFTEFYLLQPKLTKDDHSVIHHTATIIRKLWDMAGPFHGLYS